MTAERAAGATAAPERPASGGRDGDTEALARVVFAVLVIACVAAFFVTQRLKHTPTLVQNFKLAGRFTPAARGGVNEEAISFKLARADNVTVTVIDAAGNTVATLLVDRPVPRYKQFSLRWNGRRGAPHGYERVSTPGGRTILVPENRGAFAAPGEYRVDVSLAGQRNAVPSPRSFKLVGG